MLDASARLLALLSLLQRRPEWSGAELADRLGVTTRTVRRDVDRLRRLGYPVNADPGAGAGYRLGPGTDLPPLLFDDDEATAVAIALGATAGGAVRGLEEPALTALAKIDRLLPPRVRDRVLSLRAATVRLQPRTDEVDPSVLVTLSQACAWRERVRLTYRDHHDGESERRVDPYRLVATGRRWYLAAHDVDRAAWRTFRVDRVVDLVATGHRFRLEEEPDAAALVSRSVSVAPYRYAARVVVDAPATEVARRVPPTVGVTEADGPHRCVLTTGADDLAMLAGHLVSLGLPFEVVEPPELREHVRVLGERLVATHPPAPSQELQESMEQPTR